MRLLLIAYEFAPSPSPQSLRWLYLTRELARLGHDVHVLAPELGGQTPGLPEPGPGVTVHRCFAGPVRGLMAALRRRRARRIGAPTAAPATPGAPVVLRPPRGWKQRLSEAVQATAERVHYPDIRGEWRPWAARALRRLLAQLQPEVVLSSHEPATTLELGRLAHATGFTWVADLGDPVLAAYTPPRWQARARRVERATCAQADLLTVTTSAAAALMVNRHGRDGPVAVIAQGFDRAPPACTAPSGLFDPARLELFYSGSFYQFRRPDALLEALRVDPSIRLSIAAITVPEAIVTAARDNPDQVRLLGFLPHLDVLAMQRQAHVLVNIANDDPDQTPGKFNEYLGAARPILHLHKGDDAMARAITRLRRGWSCEDTQAALSSTLQTLARAQQAGTLADTLDLSREAVDDVSWQSLAAQLHQHLCALPRGGAPR